MKQEYDTLIEAAKTAGRIRVAIGEEDGPGFISPAWSKMARVERLLITEADRLLNEPPVEDIPF